MGRDENHRIAIYHTLSGNWSDGRLQCHAQAGKQEILFACFLSGGGEFHLITGGVRTVTFWKITGSGTLEPTRAYFGRKGKVQTLTCACSLRQLVVTGTVSGHIYTWDQEKRTILQSVKAHAATVSWCWRGRDKRGTEGGREFAFCQVPISVVFTLIHPGSFHCCHLVLVLVD